MTTPAKDPPNRPSDEADETQLQQAQAEGQAYLKSLEYMVGEVADTGGKQRAGSKWSVSRRSGPKGCIT